MVTLDQAGRANGWTELSGPPDSLSDFVRFFWTQNCPVADNSAARWRIVADAAAHIIVSRDRTSDGRARTRVTLVGARSRFTDSDTTRRHWVAGVRLRAGVLPLLTGLPASDFADRSVPLSVLGASAGRELADRLETATGPDQAKQLMRRFLATALRGAGVPDRRIAVFAEPARSGRSLRVRDIAAGAGVGERTLRNLCAESIGLSPVVALRARRLHVALWLALTRRWGWARVAAHSGYYDQAHMIRDFRMLLGETPGEFMRRGDAVR